MNAPAVFVAISLALVLGMMAYCAVVHPRSVDVGRPEVLR
jgi:hypothetical protein